MSTLVPPRKPGTPLINFYAYGKYTKNLNNHVKRRHMAEAGVAAKNAERNMKPYEELKVKPSIHERFNSKFYVPGKYLDPYGTLSKTSKTPFLTARQQNQKSVNSARGSVFATGINGSETQRLKSLDKVVTDQMMMTTTTRDTEAVLRTMCDLPE